MHNFSASCRFVFFFICNVRELLKHVISLPQFSLFSYLFADSDTFEMRYFSAPIRFVFFCICNVRELLKRVISLLQISLYSYRYADTEIVSNALFFSLNSLCILFYLHDKRAPKLRYFSAAILFVFLSICRFRHCIKCVISQPQFALYSFLFIT